MDTEEKPKKKPDNPPNLFKRELKETTVNRIRDYKAREGEVERRMASNPLFPYMIQAQEKEAVRIKIGKLKVIYEKIFPYILGIKKYTNSLLEQDRFTAIYLLFGKATNGLQAIFVLAEAGFHQEVMELLRSNREALELAFMFLEGDDSNPNLKRWYKDEEVKNQESRKVLDEAINKDKAPEEELPVEKASAAIYGVLSKYTHVSYSALLDSYDVFHKDFDFKRMAGYHYVKSSSLPFLESEIQSTIIGLKHFYQTVKDQQTYKEVDALLLEFFPLIQNTDNVQEVMSKFKK